jgi:GPH family glycoside/pentoside/hexuronide:cation symporter
MRSSCSALCSVVQLSAVVYGRTYRESTALAERQAVKHKSASRPRLGKNHLSKKLSRWNKFFYGAGDIGFSLTSTIVSTYLLIFMTDVVGIPVGLAGIPLLIGRSWDWINDPLVGHISDRTRTRWGRRRPFLLFGALPFGLAFAMLWYRPPWEGTLPLVAYYATAYVLYEIAATFVYMPYFALTPELTSDYDERTSLTTYRMFFSILGSLIAFTVPLLIIGTFEPQSAPRVTTMGMIFAIASALPLLLVFFGTRERQAHMALEQPRLLQSLRAAWQNRPFRYSLGIFLLTWICMGVIQLVLLYFLKYWLRREDESDLIMAVIFVTAIFALPLWQWVAHKWSKRWAYVAGVAFWAVMQILLVTVTSSTAMPIVLILCFLAGIGVAAAHVLPWAIIPDAIEWDEWQTGERHEGMFYSLTTLIHKIALSLAVLVIPLVLEFTGYQPNVAQQSPGVLWGLRILIGPVPAILLCAGILLAIRYPLTRERYAQILRDLEARQRNGGDT